MFLRKTPLWGNPNLSNHIADITLQKWKDKKVQTVADLYINDTFANFQQLIEKFNLPMQTFFKFLQIRQWVKEKTKDIFPDVPKETILETYLYNRLHTTTTGIISDIYCIINGNLAVYDKATIKGKWETDLGCAYEKKDWHQLLEQVQTVLISTKHRQIKFNILHRTYYTPYRLHKIDNISPMCQRCKIKGFSHGGELHPRSR